MPAFGRLALLLLLAAACFRDVAPPDLSATTSATSDTSSGEQSSTGDAGSSTSSTSTSATSSSSSETGCTPTPWYLDADNDGHGDPAAMKLACDQPTGHVELGDDCDDKDGARAPGQVEVCDDKDNDCDQLLDEYSAMNTSCNACTLTASGASSYAHCTFQRTYKDARLECQKRGGDLAVIQDKTENDILRKQGFELGGEASRWFIGLDDLALEGTFVWVDGSPLGYISWGGNEPNNTNGVEHCVVVYAGDGSWNDQQCTIAAPFICESALKP